MAEGLLYWTANCISKHATLHKLRTCEILCNNKINYESSVFCVWKLCERSTTRLTKCYQIETFITRGRAAGTPELQSVSTPLVLEEWEQYLKGHPDRWYRSYILRGAERRGSGSDSATGKQDARRGRQGPTWPNTCSENQRA